MGAKRARDDYAGMPNNISLKLRTWWRRDELDEQLVHGSDPDTDALLSRRAAQLHSQSWRTTCADALDNALREARRSWSVSARLPLRRVEVRECADDLISLARRLRDGRPIDIRGAAMASRLVSNGTSPLYFEAAVSLRYAVRSARLALDPVELAQPELSNVA
jgi:hypothetical protein